MLLLERNIFGANSESLSVQTRFEPYSTGSVVALIGQISIILSARISKSVFNEKERLVIALADAMADTPSNISDDLYARLRSHFSEEQLLELGAQIAFENFRARLNRVFDVESDELYKPQASVEHTGARTTRASSR